jgi:hypothetical protein
LAGYLDWKVKAIFVSGLLRRAVLTRFTQSYKLDLSRQVFFLTRFYHNRRKNDPHDLKKWSRKTRPAFLYNL